MFQGPTPDNPPSSTEARLPDTGSGVGPVAIRRDPEGKDHSADETAPSLGK